MAVPTIFSSILILINVIFFIISSSSSSATSMNNPPRNQNLILAIEEMQKANYFTFVMLIKMSQIHTSLDNLTFLMPNDRTLSETPIAGDAVPEFLRRHAVPSPLLIDHLLLLPTGSVLPSLYPGFSLSVSNHGRRNFSFNNVRIISPNICVSGFSVRCHGVDGVMLKTAEAEDDNRSSNCSCDRAAPPATSMAPAQLPIGVSGGLNPMPVMDAPSPDSDKEEPRKSGSSGGVSCMGLLEIFCSILLLML